MDDHDDVDPSQSIAWDSAPPTDDSARPSVSAYTAHSHSHPTSDPSSNSHSNPHPTRTPATTATGHAVTDAHVRDGKVELEGTSDMFVSYLVTAHSTLAPYHSPTPSSRRRFQDFVFVRDALVKDFPACVVPPLPDKHRMEYVVGDRFSPDFIERRRIDLERFLQRLARHPKLSRTALFQAFLESTEWNVYKHKHTAQSSALLNGDDSGSSSGHGHGGTGSSGGGGGGGGGGGAGGVLDTLSDTLLNAFSKLKKPDERFTAIRQHLDSFEEGLGQIERLGHRTRQRLNDLATDYDDLSNSVQGLGYLESGITEPLMRFERSVVDFAASARGQGSTSSDQFVEHVHALLSYSHAFKSVLKLRDQKQLDFEELSSYLSNVVTERDRLAGGYGYGMGLGSYFKEKIETLKGGESDMSKAARLQRLDAKIKELQDAVVASQTTSTAFNDSVLEEHETFRAIKRIEMKSLLGAYAEGQILFQRKVLESWDKTIPHIKRIQVEP